MPVEETPVTDQLEAKQYADLMVELTQLRQSYADLAQEYQQRMEQLTMVHSVLAILVEEQGGVVEINKDFYNNYDLHAANILMYDVPDSENFVIVVNIEEESDGI